MAVVDGSRKFEPGTVYEFSKADLERLERLSPGSWKRVKKSRRDKMFHFIPSEAEVE